METRDILKNLRVKNNLTQEELAERIQVTRQAVSRWETGETQPNTDTLKLLSQVFDVSINTFVFVKRKCEQKGPKKVSTFSTRFHVVSNAFPKYQMLTF